RIRSLPIREKSAICRTTRFQVMLNGMDFYSPSQVTEMTGFSVDTLRYYERIGLLLAVDRTAGGRRRYSDDDLMFLRWLRCLRDTGMPIADMLRFVELLRAGDGTRAERIEVLEQHERRVEEQIALLQGHLQHIRYKIELYAT